jgi:hypothetical protein
MTINGKKAYMGGVERKEEVKEASKKEAINEKIKSLRAKIGLE